MSVFHFQIYIFYGNIIDTVKYYKYFEMSNYSSIIFSIFIRFLLLAHIVLKKYLLNFFTGFSKKSWLCYSNGFKKDNLTTKNFLQILIFPILVINTLSRLIIIRISVITIVYVRFLINHIAVVY